MHSWIESISMDFTKYKYILRVDSLNSVVRKF